MPSEIVCFDSQIVIWGVKKFAEQSQLSMIEKTERFIESLDKEGIEVMLPMVVVTEILSREPFEKQVAILQVLQESFILKNYDSQIALECANLLRKNWDEIIDVRDETNVRKDKLKFDHIIIATAIASGCSCIYSYDPHMIKFGKGVIDVREIPKPTIQGSFDLNA